MKVITDLIDLLDNELESAKEYAERFIMLKANNDDLAEKFKTMAEDELHHSSIIYAYTIRELDRVEAVFTLSAMLSEIWEKKRKKYIEESAFIKQMISL